MPLSDQFIGTWTLVYQEIHHADGSITYPRSKNPHGLLIYDPSGYMSVQLMNPENLTGNLGDIRTALEGYLAYCGSYRIDEAAQIVYHNVQICSYPAWIGTQQERRFTFGKDENGIQTVLFKAKGSDGAGNPQLRVLFWRRLS